MEQEGNQEEVQPGAPSYPQAQGEGRAPAPRKGEAPASQQDRATPESSAKQGQHQNQGEGEVSQRGEASQRSTGELARGHLARAQAQARLPFGAQEHRQARDSVEGQKRAEAQAHR